MSYFPTKNVATGVLSSGVTKTACHRANVRITEDQLWPRPAETPRSRYGHWLIRAASTPLPIIHWQVGGTDTGDVRCCLRLLYTYTFMSDTYIDGLPCDGIVESATVGLIELMLVGSNLGCLFSLLLFVFDMLLLFYSVDFR